VKTHPLSVSYLVVGLVYLGIAGSWALHAGGVIDNAQAGWVLPLVLVLAGVIGLVAFAARAASRRRRGIEGDVDDSEISSLERAAFAPYDRDDERTRVLDGQDAPQTEHASNDEGEDR
jgi:hypothetical protein